MILGNFGIGTILEEIIDLCLYPSILYISDILYIYTLYTYSYMKYLFIFICISNLYVINKVCLILIY